ncbi:hypothetical protein GCM10012275_53970 [Longimycelium tulufanense]|uniref:Uncharacterized protein n=1 Tax=Longimycelium tulufanense TaxID=907463 RepID=A0A8J3FX37_9PSEU|nr:hypothetical protein [Longimycelium tulufanense]GGM76408.1 hypothetical protein GCM10012275_53970 [Longimycelium tulufanense]
MGSDVVALLTQLPPNPQPVDPGWTSKVTEIVGIVKYLAGWAILLCFFAGLGVWTAGRWLDHHRFARIGVIGMVVAVAGGLFYGLGYTMITSFAGG